MGRRLRFQKGYEVFIIFDVGVGGGVEIMISSNEDSNRWVEVFAIMIWLNGDKPLGQITFLGVFFLWVKAEYIESQTQKNP